MKIHPVRGELFHAHTDRQADRQTERQTGKYDEVSSRISQFCEYT
jgi:hypothetical protein